MKKIEGVFAPVATPFAPDGEIDCGRFAENLAKLGRTGLAGVVVLGSNGEFAMLSHREKVELVAAARRGLAASKLVIAGTGCESLRETIELTQEAADAGADAALVINPSYYKRDLNEGALEKFFAALADVSPMPVMLYNMPGNSGVNLSASLVVRLSKHPNIVGVKDSSGNIVQISEILAGVAADFSVFAGSGSYLFATTVLGGRGGTLAVANVAPDLCAEIYRLATQGQIAEARALQLSILELNACVTSRWGIGGMKAAMDLAGFYAGAPRLPIQPASEVARAEIRAVMETLGLVEKYR